MRMKYIVVNQNGIRIPVLFGDALNHCDVAFQVQLQVLSAGFVQILDGQVRTYGKSVSLNLVPNLQDEELITATLNPDW